MQGFTDEDALHAELWKKREAIVTSTPNMVLFDTAAKQEPTGRVRIRCPPRLQPDITMAVREAAAKAFVVHDFVLHITAAIQIGQCPMSIPASQAALEDAL